MKLLSELTESFHSMTYSWAKANWLSIHIVSFIILGIAALIMFSRKQSMLRYRFADMSFGFMTLLFLLVQLGNIYKWGPPDTRTALQLAMLSAMTISYYLPIRIMRSPRDPLMALCALMFMLASSIFIFDFVLSEVIPANVLINWG